MVTGVEGTSEFVRYLYIIVSRILVTRKVINGLRIRWIDLLDIHQTELQLV
jgi:hypothetical protein